MNERRTNDIQNVQDHNSTLLDLTAVNSSQTFSKLIPSATQFSMDGYMVASYPHFVACTEQSADKDWPLPAGIFQTFIEILNNRGHCHTFVSPSLIRTMLGCRPWATALSETSGRDESLQMRE